MNDGAKQAYLDKMTAQLGVWGAKIDVVKAKVAKEAAGARVDYHKQIESWQAKETVFKQKMTELRDVGADGFENMKAGAQIVWNEVTNIFNSIEDKTNETSK